MSAPRVKRELACGILVGFAFIAWIIALGGIGAVTNDCYKSKQNKQTTELSAAECARQFQWQWWGLWFEFFLLIAVAATSRVSVFSKAKHIWLSFMTMCTMVLMLSAREFLEFEVQFRRPSYGKYDPTDAFNAAAAGYVMLCMVNFLILIFLGLGEENSVGQQYINNTNVEVTQFPSSAPV